MALITKISAVEFGSRRLVTLGGPQNPISERLARD
jgi:hypothetical protein